jgi:hypothetical protein
MELMRHPPCKTKKYERGDLFAPNSNKPRSVTAAKKFDSAMLNDENRSVTVRRGGEISIQEKGSRSLIIRLLAGTLLGLVVGFLLQFSIDFYTWKCPKCTRTAYKYLYHVPKDLAIENSLAAHLVDGTDESVMNEAHILYIQAMLLFWAKERCTAIVRTTILMALWGACATYTVSKKQR